MLGTLGEIRLFAGVIDEGNPPPRGWLVCDGRLLPIGSYVPLVSPVGVGSLRRFSPIDQRTAPRPSVAPL